MNEDILADIRKVSREMSRNGDGMPCTMSQYRCLGRFDIKRLKERLGCWNEAVEAAGFEPRPRKGGRNE